MKIPYKNGWFGGTPIFGNTHIDMDISADWMTFTTPTSTRKSLNFDPQANAGFQH